MDSSYAPGNYLGNLPLREFILVSVAVAWIADANAHEQFAVINACFVPIIYVSFLSFAERASY